VVWPGSYNKLRQFLGNEDYFQVFFKEDKDWNGYHPNWADFILPDFGVPGVNSSNLKWVDFYKCYKEDKEGSLKVFKVRVLVPELMPVAVVLQCFSSKLIGFACCYHWLI